MSKHFDLSIVIVNWNSAEFVRQCVQSIQQQTQGLACEIIVFDNASFDGCAEMLREHYPDIIYIQGEQNLGFAKANNRAVEAAHGDSLLFLNPDTQIIGSAIIDLYRALRQLPGAGAVGAKLLNGDGTVQNSCIQSFPTIMNQVLDFEFLRKLCPQSSLWGMKPLHSATGRPAEVEVISGACLMIKRGVFEQVGRFSEDYFMYAEDADLCYKVHRAGWKNYYVPEAVVTHFGGSSSKQAVSNFSAVTMRESLCRYFRRTRGNCSARFYRGAMALAAGIRIAMLVVASPVYWLRGRREVWSGAFQKWRAVLCWSVGHASRAT